VQSRIEVVHCHGAYEVESAAGVEIVLLKHRIFKLISCEEASVNC
jgi:hypothetical protein